MQACRICFPSLAEGRRFQTCCQSYTVNARFVFAYNGLSVNDSFAQFVETEAGGVSLYKAMRQYQLAYDLLLKHGYCAGIGKNTFSCEEGDWGTSDYLTHRVIEGVPYLGLGLGAQSMGMNYLSYNEGAATKKLESYRSKILAGKFPLQDIYDLPLQESIAKMIAVAF